MTGVINMKDLFKTELFTIGDFSLTIGNIVRAVIIIVSAYLISKFFTALITRSYRKNIKPDARKLSISQLIKYLVWTIAFVFILQALGINITFLIASSAALMVGIGLGLQTVFKDFVSGIIILIEGTIKIGDVVEIDGLVMRITEIAFRVSKATTREEIDVIIPNHRFVEDNVTNWSHDSGPARFVITIGVDYSSDAKAVERILIECAHQNKDVLDEENYKPGVRLKSFGSPALEFQLFFFSDNLFRIEGTKSDLRLRILEEFKKAGIPFPIPQSIVQIASKEQ
jgi:small-conductance mechanosensitive channel